MDTMTYGAAPDAPAPEKPLDLAAFSLDAVRPVASKAARLKAATERFEGALSRIERAAERAEAIALAIEGQAA